MTNSPDDRSPSAIAYGWASRITVVAMEMVLPGLAGHWLDKKLGTRVLFLLVGLGLGCTAAAFHLIALTRENEKPTGNDD